MGFDISGFKQAFLNSLHAASNSVIQNNKIDRNTAEVQNAKDVVSAFKDQLQNISDPIGDTVKFSQNKEVTTDDLLAFVDPKIAGKVGEYIATKPVETIKPGKTPTLSSKMASLADDVDIDKLNAFLDMAYNSDLADSIASSVKDVDSNIGDYRVLDALEEEQA